MHAGSNATSALSDVTFMGAAFVSVERTPRIVHQAYLGTAEKLAEMARHSSR